MPGFIGAELELDSGYNYEQLYFCIQSSFVNCYDQKYFLLDKQKKFSQLQRPFSATETFLNFRDFSQLQRFSTSETILNFRVFSQLRRLFSTPEVFLNIRDFSQLQGFFSTWETFLNFRDFFTWKFICSLLGLNSYLNSHTCCESKVISNMPQRVLINSVSDAYFFYCLIIYKLSSKQWSKCCCL